MLVDVDRIAETHGEPASWTDSAEHCPRFDMQWVSMRKSDLASKVHREIRIDVQAGEE